jgi:hypothetical protein
MSYRFQKIYYTVLFTLFLACTPDYDFEVRPYTQENLKMETNAGLKFDNSSVEDGAKFNIKTNNAGKYTVEILDLTNKLVSRNTLSVMEGDNVYTMYTRALETGEYTFKFLDEKGSKKQSIKLFVK